MQSSACTSVFTDGTEVTLKKIFLNFELFHAVVGEEAGGRLTQ